MDQAKIEMGKIWGAPGKWMSGGILRALAHEIVDIMYVDEVDEGVHVGFIVHKLAAEKDRKVAVQIREGVKEIKSNKF